MVNRHELQMGLLTLLAVGNYLLSPVGDRLFSKLAQSEAPFDASATTKIGLNGGVREAVRVSAPASAFGSARARVETKLKADGETRAQGQPFAVLAASCVAVRCPQREGVRAPHV